MLLLVFPKCYW